MKKSIIYSALILSLFSINAFAEIPKKNYETRIGELTFTNDFEKGYPTKETSEMLLNELDFQRATQAYVWGIPYVSILKWKKSYEKDLGMENGQIVYQEDFKNKLGGLTYQTTTPYAITFIDVSKDAWFFEIPEGGEVRGSISNAWQIGLQAITKAGKYLIVGPEYEGETLSDDYIVVNTDTNYVLAGIRLIDSDASKRKKLLENIKVYPYSEKNKPNPRGYIEPDGDYWMAAHPRGLDYFKLLSEGINANGPVHERDRLIMGSLKNLGIEKGKEFNPTKEQQKLLEEASFVGESMVKAINFTGKKRFDGTYIDDSNWEVATTSSPDQRKENYDQLDGRTAWFYEAVSNDIGMHGFENGGWGQIYLTTYKDNEDEHLDGSLNYKLTLPSEPPVDSFWSITVYEVDTRTIINNEMQRADISSRHNIKRNQDGTIDLYFGENPPKGMENNWIQTKKGSSWFPYFRFYSPQKDVVDKKWILPEIEKNID